MPDWSAYGQAFAAAVAVAVAGGWWTLLAPSLMCFLLPQVSGVALPEKDIDTRVRPESEG